MTVEELRKEAMRLFTEKMEAIDDKAALQRFLDLIEQIDEKNDINLSCHYRSIKSKYGSVLEKLAK